LGIVFYPSYNYVIFTLSCEVIGAYCDFVKPVELSCVAGVIQLKLLLLQIYQLSMFSRYTFENVLYPLEIRPIILVLLVL